MKIELKKITHYYYSGNKKIEILDEFSDIIDNGEFIMIYGPSGCGKTTLLNIIGGLMQPKAGALLFDNESYYDYNKSKQDIFRGKNMGFIFQSFQLIEDLSVIDNVVISMHLLELTKLEKLERAKKVIDELGLTDRLENKINDLSGGEQQRVAIARAIAQNPSIILCDEPTGNLDKKSSQKIIDILVKLNKQGKTIIMVTHNTNLLKYANRSIELSKGNLVKGGKQYADI